METPLTPRELESLRSVSEGRSTSEAAAQMGISKRTVDDYLYRAYQKLGVRNRVQAINAAERLGLFDDGQTAKETP